MLRNCYTDEASRKLKKNSIYIFSLNVFPRKERSCRSTAQGSAVDGAVDHGAHWHHGAMHRVGRGHWCLRVSLYVVSEWLCPPNAPYFAVVFLRACSLCLLYPAGSILWEESKETQSERPKKKIIFWKQERTACQPTFHCED